MDRQTDMTENIIYLLYCWRVVKCMHVNHNKAYSINVKMIFVLIVIASNGDITESWGAPPTPPPPPRGLNFSTFRAFFWEF